MITRDDETLLREYCSGSDDAFRELALRYGAIVYAACLKSLRQPELAEDAAQAVFLVLARRADRLRVRTTLIPWLLTTSRVVCRNFARDERRRLRFEQPLHEEIAASETSMDNSIFEALDKLRGPDREAIVLRFVQGLSLFEVGRLQGISEDAARMRVKRGVSKLRRNFVPSVALPSSLLSRLATPEAAPALIQQLALKSITMVTTSSAVLAAFIGVTGIGAAGVASLYHGKGSTSHEATLVRNPAQIKTDGGFAGGPYQIPTLNSEFSLTYRVFSNGDPEGHHLVTVSSEGSDLLIQDQNDSPEQQKTSYVLDRDQRSYMPILSDHPDALSNMWVTRSIYFAPFEFIGANMPTIHPLAEPTGSGKRIGDLWEQPAHIFERGLPPERPYVSGECTFADLGKGSWTLNSLVVGTKENAARVWMLSDFQSWKGIRLASIITETSYDDAGHGRTVRDWKKLILQSKRSYSLPQELFSPEHYLKDGDNVEYKIPKQAGINLDFRYRENGTSIEDQADAQDLLELKLRGNLLPGKTR